MSDVLIAGIIWWCLPGVWVWIGHTLLQIHSGQRWSDLNVTEIVSLISMALLTPIAIFHEDFRESIFWMGSIDYD